MKGDFHMKTFQWKRLTVFLSLFLVVALFGSLYIGFYEASAANSITIKFGTGGNYTQYGYQVSTTMAKNSDAADYSVFTATDQGSYINFNSLDGQNYIIKNGDVVRIRYRIESISATEYPTKMGIRLVNTDYGKDEFGYAGLNADFTKNGKDQIAEFTYTGSNTTLTLNKFRIQIPQYSGTFTSVKLRLYEIYIGPTSSAPYKKVTYNYRTATAASTNTVEWVKSGQKPVSVPAPETISEANASATVRYYFKNQWKKDGSATGLTADTIKATTISADTIYNADYKTQYSAFFKYLTAFSSETTVERWFDASASHTAPTITTTFQNSTKDTEKRFTKWSPALATAASGNKGTTFTAQYDTYYLVTYKYRSATASNTSKTEWVKKDTTPASVPAPQEYVEGSDTATVRYHFTGMWKKNGSSTGIATATVKTTKITGVTVYDASYTTQYSAFFEFMTGFDVYNTSNPKEVWVDSGSTPIPPNRTSPMGMTLTINNSAVNERRVFSDWNQTIQAAGSTTAGKVYKALYNTQYRVIYKQLRNAYDTYGEDEWEWLNPGESPTKAKSYTGVFYNEDKTARRVLTGWSLDSVIYTPDEISKMKAQGPMALWGYWPDHWRTRLLAVDATGNYTQVLATKYVLNGQLLSTQWSTVASLPTPTTVYNKSTEAASTIRYKPITTGNQWLNYNNNTLSSSTLLVQGAWEARDYRARYETQYPVKFMNNGTLLETDWISEGSTGASYDVTLTKSDQSHVGWIYSTSSATPGASNVAKDPASTPIREPVYFHAIYLPKSFVGNSTNNLVMKRTVSLQPNTSPEDHKYRLRIDVYHYGGVYENGSAAGAMKGFFQIYDNLKMDFAKKQTIPAVYSLNYLGNGQFEGEDVLAEKMEKAAITGTTGWDSRLSNGGTNGFVFNNPTGKVWQSQKHNIGSDDDHTFFNLHFFDGFVNSDGSTASDVRHRFYCREAAGTNTQSPRGYKFVIIVDFEMDRDGTIGGNNVPISHKTENCRLEYFTKGTDGKVSSTKKYPFSALYEAKNEEWPNANIPILYDLCPHDYYMDLYDAKVPYYVSRGNMVKSTATHYQVGLITILRNREDGNEGANHEAVYGNMFTHGNMPVYARNATEENAYNKQGLPNTDVNGVRNEKVNIHYTVTHNETKKVVYETECPAYGVQFAPSNRHGSTEVDFLKDHSVTVTATVTPVDTGHTDSFGRPSDDSIWQKSVQSYYFAPRFAIADSSNNITIKTQREATSYSVSNFVSMPSVEYGKVNIPNAQRIVSTDETIGLSTASGHERIVYSFNNEKYKYEQNDITIINGIQRVSYTTNAINSPKRFASNVDMANRNLVQRYAYILPSTTMTYDQNALTYLNFEPWNMSKDENSRVSRAWQRYDADVRNANIIYGRDYTVLNDILNGSEKKLGNGLDYNGGSYYTNVDDATEANRNEWGEFTFTGTGFDIYSRCGWDTGILVAQVYDSTGKTLLQNILSDTYLDNATFYQVPVIQWRAPSHGTYMVKFRAYYHAAFDHQLYKSGAKKAVISEEKVRDIMGWDDSVPCTISLSDSPYAVESRAAKTGDYDVYIDGIRIYNPMDQLSKATDYVYENTANKEKYAAYAVYNYDKELNPKYFNVNEYIVDATNGDWFADLGANDATGLLYIAGSAGSVGDPDGDSNADQNDGYVGLTLCSTGQFNTITESYKDSKDNVYDIYYYADKDGNKILDPETGCPIFRSSQNGKIYIKTSKWTAITQSQLELILGNKIAFYDARYKTIGPAFEIYLTKGNGVAFNATSVSSAVTSIHISLRSADGGTIAPQVYDGSAWQPISITHDQDRTEQYYDITSYVKTNGGNVYIRNTGDGIMSIMNVKVVGGDTPKVNTRMIMDALEVFQISETPIEDSSIMLGHSLNLASDISLNYVVPASRLEDGENSYLRVEVPRYNGNDLVETKIVDLTPELRGSYYYYVLDGLTAVNMNDTLKATLHFTMDGQPYVSSTDEYSIAVYAFNYLNKEQASNELKALCAELLRYGEAAQLYKEYRTDALVGEEMTELHRSYLSDLGAVTFGNTNTVRNDIEAPGVTWLAKSLNLESRVSLLFMVDPGSYTAEELHLRVSYTDSNGKEQVKEIFESKLYRPDSSYLIFSFDGLLAAQLRSPVAVAVFAGEEQVSSTLDYSADTYGNNKTGTLGELCKALFAYSDAAKAYFQS